MVPVFEMRQNRRLLLYYKSYLINKLSKQNQCPQVACGRNTQPCSQCALTREESTVRGLMAREETPTEIK